MAKTPPEKLAAALRANLKRRKQTQASKTAPGVLKTLKILRKIGPNRGQFLSREHSTLPQLSVCRRGSCHATSVVFGPQGRLRDHGPDTHSRRGAPVRRH